MLGIIEYILVFFILHFILVYCSTKLPVYEYESNRFSFAFGNSKDLMLTLIQLTDNNPYSHIAVINGFGCTISFIFGHKYSEIQSTKFYGFHSDAGELIWNTFWINQKFYIMPWDTTEVFLQEKSIGDAPFKVLSDTNYFSKDGSVIPIKRAEFFLNELRWTSKLAKLFRLESIFYTRKLSLTVISDDLFKLTNKICTIKLYQETIDAYDSYMLNQTDENLDKLTKLIEERIGYFMMIDKNF